MSLVVVAGALANKPYNGGEAWVRLSWVLGLERLGFEVLFLAEMRSDVCADAAGHPALSSESSNRAYFAEVIRQVGLQGCAALVCQDEDLTWGLTFRDVLDRAARADLLVNI